MGNLLGLVYTYAHTLRAYIIHIHAYVVCVYIYLYTHTHIYIVCTHTHTHIQSNTHMLTDAQITLTLNNALE